MGLREEIEELSLREFRSHHEFSISRGTEIFNEREAKAVVRINQLRQLLNLREPPRIWRELCLLNR